MSSGLPNNIEGRWYKDGTEINHTAATLNNQLSAYTSYVPVYTGFVDNGLGTTAYYKQMGKMCHVYMVDPINGTSNATTFTISLPFTAGANAQKIPMQYGKNNSAFVSTISGSIAGGGTVVTLELAGSSTGFTASGNKACHLNFMYETA